MARPGDSQAFTEKPEEGNETFSTPQELNALAAKWSGSRLVEIWNSLPDVAQGERFTSRQVAATRIWRVIQNLQPTNGARRRRMAQKDAKATNKGIRPRAGRESTKTARVIALLQQPDGATLHAIITYASHCTSLA